MISYLDELIADMKGLEQAADRLLLLAKELNKETSLLNEQFKSEQLQAKKKEPKQAPN